MQTITMYVRAYETKGAIYDSYNAKSKTAPAFVLGAKVELHMRLFADNSSTSAYDITALQAIKAWSFGMDNDYDTTSTCKIVADNSDILVQEITEGSATYSEFIIPISSMATEELIETLGTSETTTLNGELCGYDSAGDLAFVLQVTSFTVRNRITGTTEPTESEETYLTATQVRALVAGVDYAQSGYIQNMNTIFAGASYDEDLGYYKALTSEGDTLQLVYNVTDCIALALHLKSANSEITGDISVNILVNEVVADTVVIPVSADYAWQQILFNTPFSGAVSFELVSGLTDGDDEVSVVVDSVRTSGVYEAENVGSLETNVSAKPLSYDSTYGYYLRLDDDYSISTMDSLTGVVMVKLLIWSANANITGNVVLTINEQSFIVPVSATPTWQTLTLSTVVNGVLTIERDTTSTDDTLNDDGTTVTAIVTDINYYTNN